MEMVIPKYTRILSIDGGGIKGIIPGTVLARLEEILKVKANDKNARISDYFDLIAGTSTGGILTCVLLCPEPGSKRPKYTAQKAVDLYMNKGGEIFDTSIWQDLNPFDELFDEKYSARNLQRILKEYLGDLKLSQLIKPCVITAYDIKNASTKFFTSIDAKKKKSQNYLVREVARATSAAPTYFEVAQVKSLTGEKIPLIDGGVFANNPALCAYAEARAQLPGNPKAKDMVVLSLGTGTHKSPIAYKRAKSWGKLQWVRPILDIMMSGVSETVDYQLSQIFDSVERKEQYLRVNWPLKTKSMMKMDNASKKNIAALQRAGIACSDQFEKQLEDFADLLMKTKKIKK